jgi:error-prone DNA polymerase
MEFTHLHVTSCLSAHHGTVWPGALVDAQAASRSMLNTSEDTTATVLFGSDSDVGRLVLRGEHAWVAAELRSWSRLLPGGVCVEVVCHFTRPGLPHAAVLLTFAEQVGFRPC